MINKQHRVIFFGTPAIACKCLQALIDKKINVVCVVTKPDMYVGRKQILTQSEVKILAQKNNIPILQPNDLNLIVHELKQYAPDLIITCAYGKIIPNDILIIPKYHCVNIHTSLLPRWRGGAPIHHAILHNDKTTGVTMMYMDSGLDTGNIIYQQRIDISENETYRTLYDKLSNLAYEMLFNYVTNLFSDDLPSIKQDEKLMTYAPIISSNDEKINWHTSSEQIDAQVRGLYDVPTAYTTYDNLRIKILEAKKSNIVDNKPGEIININKDGILVGCLDGSILLTKIQLPSKTPITIRELINGNHPFKIHNFFI